MGKILILGELGMLTDHNSRMVEPTEESPNWRLSQEYILKGFMIAILFLLLTGLIGCRSSFTPYDYCSPVYTGNSFGDSCDCMCDPLYRAGSKIYGTEHACKSCGLCGTTTVISDEEDGENVSPRTLDILESSGTPSEPKTLPSPVLPNVQPKQLEPIEEPDFVPNPSSSRSPSTTHRMSQPVPALPARPYTQQQSSAKNSSVPVTLEEIKLSDPNAVDVRILNVEDGLAP
ncbi:MAG: hypothetical protein ACRC10_12935 [Thermoguttaceae bacterium]